MLYHQCITLFHLPIASLRSHSLSSDSHPPHLRNSPDILNDLRLADLPDLIFLSKNLEVPDWKILPFPSRVFRAHFEFRGVKGKIGSRKVQKDPALGTFDPEF